MCARPLFAVCLLCLHSVLLFVGCDDAGPEPARTSGTSGAENAPPQFIKGYDPANPRQPTARNGDPPITPEMEAAIAELKTKAGIDADRYRVENLVTDNGRIKVVQVSDEQLKPLTQLTDLEDVKIFDSPVTDEVCTYLSTLKKLKRLKLSGTRITREGLKQLATLPNLSDLDISETQINSEDLVVLESFPTLERLTLVSCTQIDDSGIEHLIKLRKLKGLNLYATGVSAEGKSRIREALPECSL